ncbi:hypothetical protein B0O99DRAFT_626003 [Bisporella sp. PMI_857]|nr:hypothetical protein B0O99DRAFT_626003 [Bisporella sp. PMI_857]
MTTPQTNTASMQTAIADSRFTHRSSLPPPYGHPTLAKLPASSPATAPRHMTPTSTRWNWMAGAAFLTWLYALNFLVGMPPGDPIVKKRLTTTVSGLAHVIGGMTAMVLGPFQLLGTLRESKPKIHIWLGRIYAAAVVAGGLGGFQVSIGALAYPLGNAFFSLLATVWLITIAFGMLSIWNGDVAEHKKWMMRNFSLTYAAVTLRFQLPLMIICGMDSKLALSINGLSSWVPNLIFVEWWMRTSREK